MGPGNLKILNKFIIALILLGGFFVTLKSVEAAPGINKQINFQGKVTNSDGTNVATGNYNFNFRIYTVSSGGAAVWSELTKSLTVTDGIFQTNLGDATALPGSVDFNSDNIYLGIEFNGNGEMNPRVQFTATPYAFNSDTLDGKDWTNPGTIGTSATTLALASNGTSAWTNTSGNLTISTATSGTLAVTSAGALNLTGSGASYFNTTSGNLNLEVAGTGTANVQIGDGGATSATPDLLVLDIGSAEPTGTNGAMYYSTNLNKFRCFQNAG
ncbi:MAG: hypothetical protein Q7T51_04915, partial [Candidatus Moranbacteria bacterium]|nr:hypothetical protein [Candidatus Moranbacteria bacterium]